MGYIVGIGGANLDIHMKVFGDYVLHDSNPGKLFTSPGGVTRNILENLALMGCSCRLMSAVGDDAFGRAILDSCNARSIDTVSVYTDAARPTASYIDLLDKDGDMFVAASDCTVLEEMPVSWIESNAGIIRDADAVVCDTNLTEMQLEALISVKGDAPLFIDPVSTSKAMRMKDISGSFEYIKPNRIELEVLSGISCRDDADILKACDILLSRGSRGVCVSLGADGCCYADRSGVKIRKSLRALSMVNASGAGDAFIAGWIYGFCQGFDAAQCVDYALAAGALAVQGGNTINSEMSREKLDEILSGTDRKID